MKTFEAVLAEVDWASLEHMYGSAVDIPDVLRSMRSTDHEVRSKSVQRLHDAVIHQDDFASASPFVVTAIVALVREPDVFDRADLLHFLARLVGIATCYEECGGTVTVNESYFGEEHRRFGIASYQNACAVLPQLFELASGPQAATRAAACHVLRMMSTETDTVMPFLVGHLMVEDSERVRGVIVTALETLLDTSDFEEPMKALHDNDPSLLVRTAAAYHLAFASLGDESVARTLIEAIDNPEVVLNTERRKIGDDEQRIMLNIGGALAEIDRDNERTDFEFLEDDFDGDPAQIELAAAIKQLAGGDAQGALAKLTALEESLPDDWYRITYHAMAKFQADGVVADITTRLPKFSLAWHHSAIASRATGDLAAALSAADKAIEIANDEAPYYVNRAALRVLTSDLDGALADARKAVDRDPDSLKDLETDPDLAAIRQTAEWAAIQEIAR